MTPGSKIIFAAPPLPPGLMRTVVPLTPEDVSPAPVLAMGQAAPETGPISRFMDRFKRKKEPEAVFEVTTGTALSPEKKWAGKDEVLRVVEKSLKAGGGDLIVINSQKLQKPKLQNHNYRTLDADRIIDTARTLSARIHERFPESSLSKVAEDLVKVAEESATTAYSLTKPVLSVRIMTGAAILALTASVAAIYPAITPDVALFSSIADFLQGLDAGVNGLILFGGAIYYLVNRESHIKTNRALKAIRALREMSHIIDMHQLTKDPERLAGSGPDTPSSPERQMSPFELTRYLNYSSEMLAIIGKIAALYVQGIQDPVALGAVDEVQDLTNGLSQKMWQKIMILDRIMHEASTPGRVGE